MTRYLSPGTLALVTVAFAALTGCAAYSVDQPAVTRIAPGDARIVFADDEFKGTASVHVRFTDSWQHEEYALFHGNGSQAEILYSSAETGYQLALEYLFTVERSVETWNLNRKYTRSWGETEWFRGPFVGFFYQPYQLVEVNRSCFGFSFLFGYYCAGPGGALTRDRMEALLERIGVRGITERIRRDSGAAVARVPDAGHQAEATRLARGGAPGTITGNPGFPFDLARYYQVGNGDNEFD
jgi:hypothetical protein